MEPEITKKDIAFMSKEQRAELIAKVKDQDQPANESVQSDGDMTPNEPMIEQKPIAVKENQQSVSPDNVPSPAEDEPAMKLRDLEEKYQKQLKRNEDHELFIRRQSNQLGELKKILSNSSRNVVEQQHVGRSDNDASELDRIKSEIAKMDEMDSKRTWLLEKDSDFETRLPAIIKLAMEEGFISNNNQAVEIAQNPYTLNPNELYFLAKRVAERDRIALLETQLATQASELERVRSGIKGVPTKLKDAASNSSISPVAKNLGGKPEVDISGLTREQLSKMSKKDLQALRKRKE